MSTGLNTARLAATRFCGGQSQAVPAVNEWMGLLPSEGMGHGHDSKAGRQCKGLMLISGW